MTFFSRSMLLLLAVYYIIQNVNCKPFFEELNFKKDFEFNFKPIKFLPIEFALEKITPFKKLAIKHVIGKRYADDRPYDHRQYGRFNYGMSRFPYEVYEESAHGERPFPHGPFFAPPPVPVPPPVPATPEPKVEPEEKPVSGLNTNIARAEPVKDFLTSVNVPGVAEVKVPLQKPLEPVQEVLSPVAPVLAPVVGLVSTLPPVLNVPLSPVVNLKPVEEILPAVTANVNVPLVKETVNLSPVVTAVKPIVADVPLLKPLDLVPVVDSLLPSSGSEKDVAENVIGPDSTKAKPPSEKDETLAPILRGSRLALYFGNILLEVISQVLISARASLSQITGPLLSL